MSVDSDKQNVRIRMGREKVRWRLHGHKPISKVVAHLDHFKRINNGPPGR